MQASSPDFPRPAFPGGSGNLGLPGTAAVPIAVHLVAPPLTSWGLQRLVQSAGAPFCLTGVSPTLAEAVQLLERQPPDVVVLDFDDEYDAADVATLYDRLRMKVLVLTSVRDEGFLDRLLQAGARGVLHKRGAPSALLKAIQAIGEGEVFVPQPETNRLFRAAVRHAAQSAPDTEASRIASLTLRERQTIAAVTADDCAPAKVIAGRLCISEHTLRNHLTSIYSKLGVTGRLGLYAYASQHRLCGQDANGAKPR